jgi:hypothetical protein
MIWGAYCYPVLKVVAFVIPQGSVDYVMGGISRLAAYDTFVRVSFKDPVPELIPSEENGFHIYE